jgi:hypothetical protein
MNRLTVLIAIGLLATTIAFAQQDFPREITVSWTNPSSYTDGTAIAPGDLDSIRIEIFRNSSATPVFTATVDDSGEGAQQSEVFPAAIPGPGTYTIVGYAIVVDGSESDASDAVVKKYTGKPMPITTVTVD